MNLGDLSAMEIGPAPNLLRLQSRGDERVATAPGYLRDPDVAVNQHPARLTRTSVSVPGPPASSALGRIPTVDCRPSALSRRRPLPRKRAEPASPAPRIPPGRARSPRRGAG